MVVYTIKLKKGDVTVDIGADMVTEDVQDRFIDLVLPMTFTDQETGKSLTRKLISLKRFTRVFTIHGWLFSDENSTAYEKYQALISYDTLPADHPVAPSVQGILRQKGGVILEYRGNEYTCLFSKVSFKDDAKTHQTGDYPSKIEITIVLHYGTVEE